ncbi:MAG TPA: toast rack family protein [Candidatus Deferrimicrobium sp.]|nr:toast rack family protein [Candidatus Deferrimicrobium sp.]
MRRVLLFGLGLIVIAAGLLAAGRREQETRRIATEGAQKIETELEFGVGELRVLSDDIAEAAVVDLNYDPRRVEYDIDYQVKDETGHLYVESSTRRRSNMDSDDNRLDLTLSTRYPARLTMDIGACEAEIDFGGVPLEFLDIDVGAASGEITFSSPNPRRLSEIQIDAGASSLEMHTIGNANFEQMTFQGGAGSFDLDFRGDYNGESRIDIDVGLGSADIILPLGVPVRIESSGSDWFSSVDFHGEDLDEVDDGVYESPDFEKAESRIVLTLDVGMGSVDLYWKR